MNEKNKSRELLAMTHHGAILQRYLLHSDLGSVHFFVHYENYMIVFMNYLILKPGDDIVDVDRAVDQHRQRENISKYTLSLIFRHTYYIRHHRKTVIKFREKPKNFDF